MRLVKTANVAVPQWGTYITTGGEENPGLVKAEISVRNFTYDPVKVDIVNRLKYKEGRVVLEERDRLAIDDISTAVLKAEWQVEAPELWSPEEPNLYELETTILRDGEEIDRFVTPVGFRYFRFDGETGFYLNGKNRKFKGVCVHQDHGCVGVAVPPAIQEWRVRQLKEMGIQDTVQGERIFRRMNHLVRRLDPSRVSTYAMNCDWQSIVDRYGSDRKGRFDVLGTNYRGGGNA